jgi:hypothetical protein
MIDNAFTISATWEGRQESAADVAERFLRSLDALSTISPYFRSWGFAEENLEIEDLLEGKEPSVVGLEEVRDRFVEIVELGGEADVAGNPLPQLGYQVTACNCLEGTQVNPFTVALYVHAGGNRSACGSLIFGTEHDQVPDPSIVAYPVFKSALVALAEVWDVPGAHAFSDQLSKDWDYPALRFDLAWMTYLSAALAAEITPPAGILTERTPNGGLLLIAADKTFDVSDPEHMEAARRIRDAMAPINDLKLHAIEKQKMLENHQKLKATGWPGELITNRRIPPFGDGE